MNEIFLLSMFTGGLAHMVTQHGGLQWILEKIQSVVKSEKSAQIGISAIAAAADMAVANNTVAIIITGPIAKELSRKYKVDPRKSASLLDIWTCIFQGFIPYGAQILLAGSLTAGAVSPLALFPFLWFQQLLATQHGGLQWILEKIQSVVKSEKSAQIGISAIAAAADMAVANNTVAIIITGPIAKELSRKYKVDPRKSASLLDIWTCIFQGFIPYGAQILLAGSLTAGAVSPLALFPFLWFQQLLAVFTLISMFIPYADGLIKKRPWNWELDKAEEITE